jgi:hypothetical protein
MGKNFNGNGRSLSDNDVIEGDLKEQILSGNVSLHSLKMHHTLKYSNYKQIVISVSTIALLTV